jgi:hypothetical protein
MRRGLVSLLAAASLVIALGAAPVSAGTSKYVWTDATTAYAGPAAMLVNNAGAIVWWHIPNQTTLYKDVYRFHDFDGSTFWGPVGNLNAPVNSLMLANFPANPDMWYTREVVDSVPNLGKPTTIYTLRDYRTMTSAETARFYLATQTISGGYITVDPYVPAIELSAQGLAPSTAGYVDYIQSGGGWVTLGSLTTTDTGQFRATIMLEKNTTYSGYFAINYLGATQFIAGPFTFTTAP